MIYVGIDDTDSLESRGTNQLALALVAQVAANWRPILILRHQLLQDPRVPMTRKNGSASILLEPRGVARVLAGCARHDRLRGHPGRARDAG